MSIIILNIVDKTIDNLLLLVYNILMYNKIDSKRIREIIKMRNTGYTFQVIGDKYGISRQRAQKIYSTNVTQQNTKLNPIYRLLDKLYRQLTKRLIIDPDGRED